MHVLRANGKFEVQHKNELGEECYASPAVSRGQLFIRALHNLYCIGEEGKLECPLSPITDWRQCNPQAQGGGIWLGI